MFGCIPWWAGVPCRDQGRIKSPSMPRVEEAEKYSCALRIRDDPQSGVQGQTCTLLCLSERKQNKQQSSSYTKAISELLRPSGSSGEVGPSAGHFELIPLADTDGSFRPSVAGKEPELRAWSACAELEITSRSCQALRPRHGSVQAGISQCNSA